jgi:gamma-glutamyltranspeptidase/glutathione hydrolase
MPPPSSGGIALLQMLKMLEAYDLKKMGFHSAEYIHLLTEVQRRVYADRASYLGDPDFYKVPVKSLLNESYLNTRMKNYNPNQATPSSLITAGTFPLPKESEETTHFSIIDKDGNAVSITTTLNSGYGSKVVVEGAGFILNNEMDDFSIKAGVPNQFGLIGAEANAIQPNKRMLSSMTPTIIIKDGKVQAIIGTPGGSTIITTVLQMMLNIIDFKMKPTDVVQESRFHSQWLPDVLYYEKDCLSESVKKKLIQMGHHLQTRSALGKVEAIMYKQNQIYTGVADNRGDDDVEVVKN